MELDSEGTQHTVLRVANVGSAECTLHGHATLDFVGENNELLPMSLEENPAGPSAEPVTIGTREAVLQDFWWEYTNTDGRDPAATCTDPVKVRVFMPGEDTPFFLDWGLGAVCNGGRVEHGQLFAE